MENVTLLSEWILNIILIFNIIICYFIFYLSKYIKEILQILPTKHEVGRIINLIEGINQKNAKELETLAQFHRSDIKRINQINDLRLAAIDERLKAYQEAYSLVFEMLNSRNNEILTSKTIEAFNHFWANRSLYISEDVRKAMDEAMKSLVFAPDENSIRVTNALRVIEKELKLPEINSIAETLKEKVEPDH